MKEYCDKHQLEYESPPLMDLGCPACVKEMWLKAQLEFAQKADLNPDSEYGYEDSLDALSYLLGDPECFCQKHGRFIPAGVLKDCPECQAERYFEWKPEGKE